MARRIRSRVEVAGNDRRKGPAVAGIEISQRDRLALTGGFPLRDAMTSKLR